MTKTQRTARSQLGLALRILAGLLVAAFLIVGGSLAMGAYRYDRVYKLSGAIADIKLATFIYEVNNEGVPAASFHEVEESGCLAETPIDPFSGEPMELVSLDDDHHAGGFTYYVVESGGESHRSIVVGYAPAPSWQELLWAQTALLFIDESSAAYRSRRVKLPSSTRPALAWTGGPSGNCEEYIARGLSPRETLDKLGEAHPDESICEAIAVELPLGRE